MNPLSVARDVAGLLSTNSTNSTQTTGNTPSSSGGSFLSDYLPASNGQETAPVTTGKLVAVNEDECMNLLDNLDEVVGKLQAQVISTVNEHANPGETLIDLLKRKPELKYPILDLLHTAKTLIGYLERGGCRGLGMGEDIDRLRDIVTATERAVQNASAIQIDWKGMGDWFSRRASEMPADLADAFKALLGVGRALSPAGQH